MYLGVEVGGTKLQMGIGDGAGRIVALWRGAVEPRRGSAGIQEQLRAALPVLTQQAGISVAKLRGAGIGFGGPTDDATQSVITSHQIAGWDNFPLAEWFCEQLGGIRTVICNDADVAGLAEALFGAGRGLSPLFYVTVGSGIGGGLIIDGRIYRGVGRGAAEIGHIPVGPNGEELEAVASGWGIAARARRRLLAGEHSLLRTLTNGDGERVTTPLVVQAAAAGDPLAADVLQQAIAALAEALDVVIRLLCPRRIVIGGGVSLIGEERLFVPLRQQVTERAFPPFRGLTDIVPAQLGEEVVVHGALALARQTFELTV